MATDKEDQAVEKDEPSDDTGTEGDASADTEGEKKSKFKIKIPEIDFKKYLPILIGKSTLGTSIRVFTLFCFCLITWLMIKSSDTMHERLEKIPNQVIAIDDDIEREKIPEEYKEASQSEQDKDEAHATDYGQFDELLSLPEAPIHGNVDLTSDGPMPIISPEGAKPYIVYARPSNLPKEIPKISIILTELGINKNVTEEMIAKLPGKVSLAFSPYTQDLEFWGRMARQSGHEYFIELPLESTRYPKEETGPYGILSHLPPKENDDRLKWIMTRASGYAGLINLHRSRVTALLATIDPILRELKMRGLLYLDPLKTERSAVPVLVKKHQLPFIRIDAQIDTIPSDEYINATLKELEIKALKQGHVVATMSPYPISVIKLLEWLPTLESKGIALVPASAYYVGSEKSEKVENKDQHGVQK